MNHEIYLYGMITVTNSLLLQGKFPAADNYSEVAEKWCFPGGETGSAATVLASFGCKVKMDGNFLGYNTEKTVREFYQNIGVDISRLRCVEDYDGVDEVIIIDKDTRTTFGQFATYFKDFYEEGIIRWNMPYEEDIKGAKAAGIDPPFGKEALRAAQMCRANGVPFVTIDERPANEISKLASIIVVSSDWIRDFEPTYCSPDGKKELMKIYMENTDALVVFTGGGGTSVFGRRGRIGTFEAHKIETVSTLGAGDTFKAACIYALAQGWDDEKTLKFANAAAAVTCTRFPLPKYPPKLDEAFKLAGI